MKDKTRKIIGWCLSALPLAFLAFGGVMKFVPSYSAEFAKMFPTFAPSWVFGLVLIACVVLYIVPRTQVIGFALSTAYYGGAAALAWQVMGGFMNALPIFAAMVLLWTGQAMLRPSLLKAAKA